MPRVPPPSAPCPSHGRKLRELKPEPGADRVKCFCAACKRFYGYRLIDPKAAPVYSCESDDPDFSVEQQELFEG